MQLLQKYVLNGGVLMFVLVPCSVLMLASILQGMIRLRRGWMIPRWIFRKAGQVKDAESRREFLLLLRGHGSPLARVLWLTLKDFTDTGRRPARALVQGRLDDAIIQVSDRLYESVGLLSTIYTVGPLLGLVGTILGLMDTFHSYSALLQPSVQALSEGVQKALVTTFWGLSMAIPAFVAGQWMQSKIRAYERDKFPESVWHVIEMLYGPAPADLDDGAEEPAGGAILEVGSEA